MDLSQPPVETRRYAKCIDASKRVRWDIDRDLIRDRQFDFGRKFLPDGLSMVDRLPFLGKKQKLLFSHVQGRTYANMFALVERFIGAKMISVMEDHALGDQIAFEALVRFTDEELKHQDLFRRVETMIAPRMPDGYEFLPNADEVAQAVLGASTWAVLGLTCCIELFTQVHYRSSIAPDESLSDLWKDVFLFHWREESQHAIIDELEWSREDKKIDKATRDQAVDDLIGLVAAVDGIVQAQAEADAKYFIKIGGPDLETEHEVIADAFLRAYRYQYIVSGVCDERYTKILNGFIDAKQNEKIVRALTPIIGA